MYIHTPSRQDAVVFLTSIATMISETVDLMLKDMTLDHRHPLTMEQICNRKMNTVLRYDRDKDSVTILGEPEDGRLIMDILRRLDIEPDLLLGH